MDRIPHQARLSINGFVYKINPDGTQKQTESNLRHLVLYFDGMTEEESEKKMDKFLKECKALWKTTT